MVDLFIEPSIEQKANFEGLVGNQISIFWDGENEYFPAKVINYAEGIHTVRYDSDEPDVLYPETLNDGETKWKIWSGTKEEYSVLYDQTKTKVKKILLDSFSINLIQLA